MYRRLWQHPVLSTLCIKIWMFLCSLHNYIRVYFQLKKYFLCKMYICHCPSSRNYKHLGGTASAYVRKYGGNRWHENLEPYFVLSNILHLINLPSPYVPARKIVAEQPLMERKFHVLTLIIHFFFWLTKGFPPECRSHSASQTRWIRTQPWLTRPTGAGSGGRWRLSDRRWTRGQCFWAACPWSNVGAKTVT